MQQAAEVPSVHPEEATKPSRASCLSYFVAATLLVLGLTEVSLRLGVSIFQTRQVGPPELSVAPELRQALSDDSRSFFDTLAFVSAWHGPTEHAAAPEDIKPVVVPHDLSTPLTSPPAVVRSPLPNLKDGAHAPAKRIDPREEEALDLEKEVSQPEPFALPHANAAHRVSPRVTGGRAGGGQVLEVGARLRLWLDSDSAS